MRFHRVVTLLCLASVNAFAQPFAEPPQAAPQPMQGAVPASAPMPTTDPSVGPALGGPPPATDGAADEPKADSAKQKEPKRGDFDAGAQARFPSGPDEAGTYESFNWVAADLKGRYFLLDQVFVDATIPLAVKKPDMAMIGGATVDPRLIGGITARLEAKVAMPKMPGIKHDTEAGLQLTLGYMREGAMLLAPTDFPLFAGDFKPGIATGLLVKVKLSTLVDFNLVPAWVYQSGTMDSLTAVQIPMSLRLALGDVAKLSADLGIFTGDDYAFSGRNGGRISTGGALDLKVGPILVHAGAGVASLLSGGMYPSISESVYVDVNVKYAK
jgi:hypothetical protein